jgi:tRNA dimethylallyltransferase
MNQQAIAILGTTASGKSGLALRLAQHLAGEIVSIDSMKIYRGMDIGTAKPSRETRALVPHHLIDVAEPSESFSAAQFVERADAAIDDIHARGKPVILSGGTILYFQCLYRGMFEGPGASDEFRRQLRERAAHEGLEALHAELARIDPQAAGRIHRNDAKRIERALEVFHLTGTPISRLQRQWGTGQPRRADWRWTLIGLRRPQAEESRRINERVRRMLANGLIEEVRALWTSEKLAPQAAAAVGYAELMAHFRGEFTLEEASERIKINSRRLAKHQRTWLRRMTEIRWIHATDQGGLLREALGILESNAEPLPASPQAAP